MAVHGLTNEDRKARAGAEHDAFVARSLVRSSREESMAARNAAPGGEEPRSSRRAVIAGLGAAVVAFGLGHGAEAKTRRVRKTSQGGNGTGPSGTGTASAGSSSNGSNSNGQSSPGGAGSSS